MRIDHILSGLEDLRALVVGDICLDRWCYYDPAHSEPSRETGIPRLAVTRTETTPGAGGTIANNLAALGVGSVSVLGSRGNDGFGTELINALAVRNIAPDLMVRDTESCTFTYTKLINCRTGIEDQPRVDFINAVPASADVQSHIIESLKRHINDFDLVLVSDQAETDQGGIVTEAVRSCINDLAAELPDKLFWVDSRMRSEHFLRVVLKPNQSEADAACMRAFGSIDYIHLLRHSSLRMLVVTEGAAGVRLLTPSLDTRVPGRKVKPVDICGAGDSFSAGAACALAITDSPVEAAKFGNLVASITVTKPGTGTATPEELLTAAAEWDV